MTSDSVGSLPWYVNYTITNGTSALVDGAKRDRLVWAGDMAIAVPGVVSSTNDLISIQNSLNSLFDIQKSTGQLPYAGRPFRDSLSHTYHLYTIIGVADYFLYSVSDLDHHTSAVLTRTTRATSTTSRPCGTTSSSP